MADDPPPFDMTRAVFWLVAFVIVVAMLGTAATVVTCVISAGGIEAELERCGSLRARDFVVELLATVLVLLNVKRPDR